MAKEMEVTRYALPYRFNSTFACGCGDNHLGGGPFELLQGGLNVARSCALLRPLLLNQQCRLLVMKHVHF